MYHYVYRITNINCQKYYYGVRSSKCLPLNDLSVKYFSSSSDKIFLKEQQEIPENFKYKIIKMFSTRIKANKFEEYLHEKFNVGANILFYNRCKASAWSDRTGIKLTEEHKKKINAKGRRHSEETKKKMSISQKGRTFSKETKKKMSEARKGKPGPIHSIETRIKLSNINKNRIFSEETKKKMSKAKQNISNETRNKLSIANKSKPRQVCPHCNKEFDYFNAKRWHFDNCKFKGGQN